MKKRILIACLLSASICASFGCGDKESEAGPAPKFGSAAGPAGQAAGSGTPAAAEPVKGASSESN